MENEICGVVKNKKKFYFTFNKNTNIITIQPRIMEKYVSFFSEHEFKKYDYLIEPDIKYYKKEYPNLEFDYDILAKSFSKKEIIYHMVDH